MEKFGLRKGSVSGAEETKKDNEEVRFRDVDMTGRE